jgi:5-formyltetrahydrofolate cyclo-ligase
MGISEPAKTAPVVDPDVLLVPLLAFDKRGYRLGYGGGYYDCTLAALRQKREIIALGIGFACQEVADIPIASYDARLDKIVTETGVF